MKRVGMVLRVEARSSRELQAILCRGVAGTSADVARLYVQSYSIYLKAHQEGEWWGEMEEAFHRD
jgi:L-rhamnose mutarotase